VNSLIRLTLDEIFGKDKFRKRCFGTMKNPPVEKQNSYLSALIRIFGIQSLMTGSFFQIIFGYPHSQKIKDHFKDGLDESGTLP